MKNKELKDCCYKAVFQNKAKRLGRAHYVCPTCGEDVSLLVVFYQQSQDGTE